MKYVLRRLYYRSRVVVQEQGRDHRHCSRLRRPGGRARRSGRLRVRAEAARAEGQGGARRPFRCVVILERKQTSVTSPGVR
jgi:hypothetical protein